MKFRILFYLSCIITIPVLLGSCNSSLPDNDQASAQLSDLSHSSLLFDMNNVSTSIVSNTRVYLFSSDRNKFDSQITSFTRKSTQLGLDLEPGNWNLVLVSDSLPLLDKINTPSPQAFHSVLWQTPDSEDNLPDMPQIRLGLIDKVAIVKGRQTRKNVAFYRNEAKIQFSLQDTTQLSTQPGAQSLELLDVPLAIDWQGRLYPDAQHPLVARHPMQKSFVLSAPQAGTPRIQFIIPAHRGSDSFSANPADTTTSKLRVKLHLSYKDGTHLDQVFQLPKVPRVNKIMDIVLHNNKRSFSLSCRLLDWAECQIDTHMGDLDLSVDKAKVTLQAADTLYYSTTARDMQLQVDPSATWLTVKKLSDHAIALQADLKTYQGTPRTTLLNIRLNDAFTKAIPVVQGPDPNLSGSLKLSKHTLRFKPSDPFFPIGKQGQTVAQTTDRVTVTSSLGDWRMLSNTSFTKEDLIKGDTQGRDGKKYTLLFKGKNGHYPDRLDALYGNDAVVLMNTATLQTDTLRFCNYFLDLPYDKDGKAVFNVSAPEATVKNIRMYGGSGDLDFYSDNAWIKTLDYDKNQASLKIAMDEAEPEDGKIPEGEILITDKDYPDYHILAKVVQKQESVTLPQFNYFLFKWDWSQTAPTMKGDIKAGFENVLLKDHSFPADKFLGYAGLNGNDWGDQINYPASGDVLEAWGGDYTCDSHNNSETIYLCMNKLNDIPTWKLDRYLTYNLYFRWLGTSLPADARVKCTLNCFRTNAGISSDGCNGFTFYSSADNVKKYEFYVDIRSIVDAETERFKLTHFTLVGRLVYDRQTGKSQFHSFDKK